MDLHAQDILATTFAPQNKLNLSSPAGMPRGRGRKWTWPGSSKGVSVKVGWQEDPGSFKVGRDSMTFTPSLGGRRPASQHNPGESFLPTDTQRAYPHMRQVTLLGGCRPWLVEGQGLPWKAAQCVKELHRAPQLSLGHSCFRYNQGLSETSSILQTRQELAC